MTLTDAQQVLEFRSTPLYEGRHYNIIHGGRGSSFRSTPLYEGRPVMALVVGYSSRVSIHAPVRGATRDGPGGRLLIQSFDPRPCTRGDRRRHERV